MKSKITSLSIAQVERSEEPDVWCLNTSHGDTHGEIMFQCQGRGNNTISVMVPMTFVAINLTDQIAKTYLLDSENFRRAVSRGGITLIDSAMAEKINATSGASEEIARVKSMAVNVGVLESIDTITGSRTKLAKSDNDTKPNVRQRTASASAAVEKVSAKVQAIMIDDQSEMSKINRLRTIRGELTSTDAVYIRQAAERKGWTKLVKAAATILAELEEAE